MAKLFSTILITFDTEKEGYAEKLSGRIITNVKIDGEPEGWHENIFEANSYEECQNLFKEIEKLFNGHASFYGKRFGS